jgi:hypothetical protein
MSDIPPAITLQGSCLARLHTSTSQQQVAAGRDLDKSKVEQRVVLRSCFVVSYGSYEISSVAAMTHSTEMSEEGDVVPTLEKFYHLLPKKIVAMTTGL